MQNPQHTPARITSADEMERFAAWLTEARATFTLDRTGNGERVLVTLARGPYNGKSMLLHSNLAPGEAMLARLLCAWGDGYGTCLFYDLWGPDAQRYGTFAPALRRAALRGPASPEAEHLVETVAASLWQIGTTRDAAA